MVTARKRALLTDFALGIVAVAVGALADGVPGSLDGLLIAGTGLFAFVTVLYVAEHTAVLALINRTRPMSLVLTCVMFTAVGVALIVGQGVVATPAATLLLGMGVGLLGYRIRLGITQAVPEKRLEQARMWGSPPERSEMDSDRFS